MDKFVIISGCSGGGKSTLIGELSRRGFACVGEPGRRIVREELEGHGAALPWNDSAAFARRAIEMSLADRAAAAENTGWTFFDRGLIDAASTLDHLAGAPVLAELAKEHRCNERVFLAPPWPEIFANDAERRHSFEAAAAEYGRLAEVYPSLGYKIVILPKVDVAARADFVLSALALGREGCDGRGSPPGASGADRP